MKPSHSMALGQKDDNNNGGSNEAWKKHVEIIITIVASIVMGENKVYIPTTCLWLLRKLIFQHYIKSPNICKLSAKFERKVLECV